ncbi:hypothetical protein IW262DRAFT_1466788 [Armillaria fumosa]|nr:hypothetical protein IW262DRAFT_1466788 [Armillaria fumosa]
MFLAPVRVVLEGIGGGRFWSRDHLARTFSGRFVDLLRFSDHDDEELTVDNELLPECIVDAESIFDACTTSCMFMHVLGIGYSIGSRRAGRHGLAASSPVSRSDDFKGLVRRQRTADKDGYHGQELERNMVGIIGHRAPTFTTAVETGREWLRTDGDQFLGLVAEKGLHLQGTRAGERLRRQGIGVPGASYILGPMAVMTVMRCYREVGHGHAERRAPAWLRFRVLRLQRSITVDNGRRTAVEFGTGQVADFDEDDSIAAGKDWKDMVWD